MNIKDIKTRADCPVGTVATIGHPANGILTVKGASGWRYVESGELLDYDDVRKATWDVVSVPLSSADR